MSIVVLHVLCEGQTEANFVKEVLAPYLSSYGIVAKSQLLNTSRQKKTFGGMQSYQQVKRDLSKMFAQFVDTDYEKHFFTSMFDFYALPSDFPSFDELSIFPNAYQKVEHLEKCFAADVSNAMFIPYIQLHEYEALVFCGLDFLKEDYCEASRDIDKLKQVLTEFDNNPELINSARATAPSKRITSAIEKTCRYNKSFSGANVAKSVGIEHLKEKCKHFSEWVERFEKLNGKKL